MYDVSSGLFLVYKLLVEGAHRDLGHLVDCHTRIPCGDSWGTEAPPPTQ